MKDEAIKEIARLRALSKGLTKGEKVVMIESEKGWGRKVDETLFFPDKETAVAYVNLYNTTHNTAETAPNWYIKAELAENVIAI